MKLDYLWNWTILIFKQEYFCTGPKTTTIRARQIVEASDNEVLICGNVPQPPAKQPI